jgi:hypothetical protein
VDFVALASLQVSNSSVSGINAAESAVQRGLRGIKCDITNNIFKKDIF